MIELIITQLIIPEIAAWLRKEPDLTDDQIIARYMERRDSIIRKGRAFLAATENPTPPSS
jgi:hypothetical protein